MLVVCATRCLPLSPGWAGSEKRKFRSWPKIWWFLRRLHRARYPYLQEANELLQITTLFNRLQCQNLLRRWWEHFLVGLQLEGAILWGASCNSLWQKHLLHFDQSAPPAANDNQIRNLVCFLRCQIWPSYVLQPHLSLASNFHTNDQANGPAKHRSCEHVSHIQQPAPLALNEQLGPSLSPVALQTLLVLQICASAAHCSTPQKTTCQCLLLCVSLQSCICCRQKISRRC